MFTPDPIGISKFDEEILRRAKINTPDKTLAMISIAYEIVRYCLGEDWFASHAALSSDPDDFMLNNFDEGSSSRFTYMSRVCELAESLFTLRRCENIDLLVERFQSRSTRPCFYEARIASFFLSDGFKVKFNK